MAKAKGAKSSTKRKTPIDSIAHLNRLREDDETGVLRFASEAWGDGEIYLLGGTVISCATTGDRAILSRFLAEAGVLPEETLDAIEAADAGEFTDLLADDDRVSGEQLADAEGDLFRTGLLHLLGPPRDPAVFVKKDSVFPPNMQLGFDIPSLLDEVSEWRSRMDAVLSRFNDDSRWRLDGESPLAAGGLGDVPRTMAEILDSLGIDRFLSVERAALLLAEGGLVPASHLEEDPTEAPSVAKPLSVLDDSSRGDSVLDIPGDVSLPEDPDDSLDRSHELPPIALALDAAKEAALSGEDQTKGLGESEEGDEGLTAADYEKAAAGGFIKSYEVLDKVDLSGVDVLGAGPQTDPSLAPIELRSLGEIEAIGEIEGLEEEEEEPPEIEVSRGPSEDTDSIHLTPFETGDFEAGDFETVFDQGSADTDATVAAPDSSDGEFETNDHDGDAQADDFSALDENARARFDNDKVAAFVERVGIFNSIFRIIFATFSENIGDSKARQRFNALLGSSQRQYPELFRRLQVDADGSIEPASLINNLAACPPSDFGSLLHQGLYELIFSHLYDAKDLLPGDAETKMMEKIVVYERQLHDV